MVLSIPFGSWLSNPTSHTIDRVNPNRSAAHFDLTPPALDQWTSLEADLTPERAMYCLATGPRRPRDEPLPDKLGRGAPEGEAWAVRHRT
jgi:hypothetical protein